jgi:hypothetical protein
MAIRLLSCALATGLLLMSHGASAETIRCGNYLIQDGERSGATKYEVLKKCGEPASRMGHTWVYQKGKKAIQLRFNGAGQLETIRSER